MSSVNKSDVMSSSKSLYVIGQSKLVLFQRTFQIYCKIYHQGGGKVMSNIKAVYIPKNAGATLGRVGRTLQESTDLPDYSVTTDKQTMNFEIALESHI